MAYDLTKQLLAIFENPVELAGAITGFLCVWLAARESVLNWPVAIVSTILYCWVFYHSKLYSDALLQVIFIVTQVYGWWLWTQHGLHKEKQINRMSANEKKMAVIVIFLATLVWWFLLVRIKPDASLPAIDSLTTVGSLVAVYLQAHKKLESWLLWIFIDIIYLPMYCIKGLWITAILYALFLGLAWYGYQQWKRILDLKTVDEQTI